jgi:hypothetical protein
LRGWRHNEYKGTTFSAIVQTFFDNFLHEKQY